MLLYLMQHGVCFSREIDTHRSLTPVGKEQVIKSAQATRILGVSFQLIVSSPHVRARQTAEIMAHYTGYPVSRVIISETLQERSQPQEILNFIKEYEGLDSMLLVGHLPSIAITASTLLTNTSTLDIKIENGGLMLIEVPTPSAKGTLHWSISPSQLHQIASP